ncbi:MAG: hypothetical protein OXG81_12620 [Acidobacteria bacterium]|nr:hypothetical protein [Acidobacteriota bacterium]MCY3966844.1 hypothetical protein [Acidobacteriota bacterium]
MADRLAANNAPLLCRRLRWKTMFMALAPSEPGADIDPQHEIDDGFVWCTHSMNCLGPDGVVASKEHCREGRGCFERYGQAQGEWST